MGVYLSCRHYDNKLICSCPSKSLSHELVHRSCFVLKAHQILRTCGVEEGRIRMREGAGAKQGQSNEIPRRYDGRDNSDDFVTFKVTEIKRRIHEREETCRDQLISILPHSFLALSPPTPHPPAP